MRNIIIDCDPGHDDVMAITVALAHPEQLNILGISTVTGNQNVDAVTRNILDVLEYYNVDIPVYKGASKPLKVKPNYMSGGYEGGGLDGSDLPRAKRKCEKINAVEFMYKTLKTAKQPVTLIGLGPLTNIANLITAHPEVIDKIDSLHVMGGSIYSGNALAKAEFNFYHDPHAAKIVFDSKIKVVMSGLEVCDTCSFAHSKTYEFSSGKASSLTKKLLKVFFDFDEQNGHNKTSVFDAVPIINLLKPELFKYKEYDVDIITSGKYTRGMSVVDLRDNHVNSKPTIVLTKGDRNGFSDYFFSSIKKLDTILAKNK